MNNVRPGEGPSWLCSNYLVGARHLTYMGLMYRFSEDKVPHKRDPFFAEFCQKELGNQPENLFTKYELSVVNKEAGYKSLAKYNKDQPVLNQGDWDTTLTWAEKHFACMRESAVLEDDTEEGYEAILQETNKSASSGYPWNLWYPLKRDFYESKYAKPAVKQYWEDLKKPSCRPVFWTNNVKEEMRNREKLALNRLRTFTGAPTELNHASIKLFHEMNQRFYETANHHFSFVGGSKFRLGFDKLFHRLNKHPNVFCLDETEYDSSLFREAMYGMAEFRVRMLRESDRTPENINRIWNVYREIVDSFIVAQNGEVVLKETGNPSGSPNTIVDNTIILYRLLAYAWIQLSSIHAPELCTYEAFHKNVEAALNGDDNTWSCSDEVVGWFNATTVSAVWSSIGITTKYDTAEPRKLEDCDFLSLKWRKLNMGNGIYVPVPSEPEKVLCSLAYHNDRPTNVRFSLLRALALRIESYWDDTCRNVISQYISWLLKVYWKQLKAARNVKDPQDLFEYDQVWSVYKTDTEIKNLYLGFEGKNSTPAIDNIFFEAGTNFSEIWDRF